MRSILAGTERGVGGGENEEHELDARNLFGEPDGSQTGRGESFEDDELFRNVLL
jgi:hypothetical protein